MHAPIRDRSGETLQWIVVGLSTVVLSVAVVNVAMRSEEANPPQVTSTAPLQASPEPIALPAHSPSQVYHAPKPQTAPAYTGPTPEQIRRYTAMQENCYRVTRLNSNGEYPALQTSACNDYARYARSVGLKPGELPNVLVAQATRPSPAYEQQTSSARKPPTECAYLEESRQNIHKTTRQSLTSPQTEYYRAKLREIDAQMWDLNCRNH